MSLEQKIKALLEKRQNLEEKLTLPASSGVEGDQTPVPSGSSQQPEIDELDPDAPGIDAAKKAPQEVPPQMQGDATTVTVPAMEATEVELKDQIKGLFEGVENVTDEFISKATGVFEAAVIARANAAIIKLTEEIEAKTATELEETKVALAGQVDKYIGYVVESWMKENQVAIDTGLKTEIAEGFMTGLKNLFQENFIQVPEDKVDILAQVNEELGTTKEQVNKLISENADLFRQKQELERKAVLESVTKGMVATDIDRLNRLVEGVEFDNAEMYEEKVKMIRETHFKKKSAKSAEVILEQSVSGSNDGNVEEKPIDANMKSYLQAFQSSTGFSN